jgi:hypothetical protein
MRRVDDELRDEILFACLHAGAARAAAALLAIDGYRCALQIALMTDRDGDLLIGNKIFQLKFGGLVDDLRSARIAVAVADFFEFLDDDGAQLLVAPENFLVLGNLGANLFQLAENLVD